MIKKITLALLFLLSCLSFASDIKNDEVLTLFENELSNPNIEQQLPDYIEMVKDLKQKYENSIVDYEQFINEIYVAEVQKAEIAIYAVNRGNLSKREKRLFATNVRKNAMNKVKPLYQQQIKKFFRIVGLLPSNGCDY